jgi:hypothetical protein
MSVLLRRVGWTSLALWACVGLALETAHGFKLASYLDDALTRELCTLGHAHGVGLAIVAIVVGELGLPIVPEARRAWIARTTAFAAIAIPLAFVLSAIGHPEGDPGVAIWMVPVGALALIAALAGLAHAAWRAE